MTGSNDKIALFTGADSDFLSLLDDLLSSLDGKAGGQVPGDFYVLDFGLTLDEVHGLKARHPWIKTVSIPYKEHERLLQANLYKTMLPQFVPGCDIYGWIDADIWFQDASALDDLINIAPDRELNIIAETHAAYSTHEAVTKWLNDTYGAMFVPEVAGEMADQTPLNAGMFAARGTSPLWTRWQAMMLERIEHLGPDLVTDQCVLNYLIYKEGIPTARLPAANNWMVHLAQPVWDADTQTLYAPGNLDEPLRAIHLTADAKTGTFPVRRDDEVVETGFRYSDVRQNLMG